MMRYCFLTALFLCFLTACIRVDLPETEGKQTVQYTLQLPADFKCKPKMVYVLFFTSETPAKFKMFSRKGNEVQQDSFAKWESVPSDMLMSAYRNLFQCDDETKALYLLEGDVLAFERDLVKQKAVLKVVYRVKSRSNGKNVLTVTLSNETALSGGSPGDFAAAMSQAFSAQAAELWKQISNLPKSAE